MPELLEVETIRRDLNAKIPNKKIKLVEVRKINMIKGARPKFIIKKAIEKRGTTFSDYVDGLGKSGSFINLLKVYG